VRRLEVTVLDIVTVLTAAPIRMSAAEIPAKLESIAFGEDVVIEGVKHTLYVSNDNDFAPTITDTHHPSGIDNPNTFFVFAFDDDDLQGSRSSRNSSSTTTRGCSPKNRCVRSESVLALSRWHSASRAEPNLRCRNRCNDRTLQSRSVAPRPHRSRGAYASSSACVSDNRGVFRA
jgi:hypothetical protein